MAGGISKNNILAGAFVLSGVALAVFASFLLADRSGLDSTREFTVQFRVSQGATGLKRGSDVLLGGQKVGRVLGVTFSGRGAGGHTVAEYVDVHVETRADLTIYENAVVALERPLLGTLSSINIRDVGSPDDRAPHQGATSEVEAGEKIAGMIAPPAFLADAGLGPEQTDQLRRAIADLEKSLSNAAGVLERSGPKVEAGVEDAQKLLADMRANLAEWSKRIDTTVANLEKASGRLDPLLAKADAGVDDVRAMIAEARAGVDDVRRMIGSNRERVDQIIANVESASGKLDKETMAKLNDALTSGRDALGVFSDAVSRVSTLLTEQSPNLRRTLANLRLMSDQLKLTAVEVRSQPWRLLHEPSTKELREQVLYDATRSYAEAASDLRGAAEALESASTPGTEATDLAPLTAALNESLKRYRAAEQYLMDKLIASDRK